MMTAAAQAGTDAPVARAVAQDQRCFTVVVADEIFGIPVDAVQTIFRIDVATTIPLGPAEILGLVNLRGKIVTAVSLRRRLRLPDLPTIEGALAVGIDHRAESFALVVDDVGDVITLDPASTIPLPPHISEDRARLTASAHRLEANILPILDLAAVFDFTRKG